MCFSLGRQWLDPQQDIDGYPDANIDYVVPVFTMLQFLFYVGWLKTAEALLNPYGEDDEDFDTNYMVDRHLQISYMMVDFVGQHPPSVEKDAHWDICVPVIFMHYFYDKMVPPQKIFQEELPYTVAALPFRSPPAQTSAEQLSVPIDKQQPVYPQYLGSNAQSNGGSMWRLNMAVSNILTPMIRRRKSSQTPSVYSMPGRDLANTRRESRITTLSLSPRISRKMLKSRSPSADSLTLPTIEVTPSEPSRSRKSSSIGIKPQLSPVFEGRAAIDKEEAVVITLSKK